MSKEEIADKEQLLRKLRAMNISELTGNTHNQSLDDIMKKISENKRILAEKELSKTLSNAYVPPGGWKPRPEPPGVVNSPAKTKVCMTHPHGLNQFRDQTGKWENTMHTSTYLVQTLYRIADRDPSGIQNNGVITRDEAKGVTPWTPTTDGDRNLPRASTALCSQPFRKTVNSHLEETVSRIQEEYKRHPTASERQRRDRAVIGRELSNLERKFTEVQVDETLLALSPLPGCRFTAVAQSPAGQASVRGMSRTQSQSSFRGATSPQSPTRL